MLLLLPAAFAATVVIESNHVRVDGQLVASFPSPPRAAVEAGGRLHVLTAEGLLETWTLLPPARVAALPAPDAFDLFVAGGQAWIAVREARALPIERFQGGGGAAVAAPAEPAAAPAEARVARVERGSVRVGAGRAAGFVPGAEVRFYGQLGGDIASEGIVATGRVRAADGGQARVDIARGGRVAVGDRAELHPGAWSWPVAPERLGGVRELGLVIRPVLALDTVGVALVNDAWLHWAFESPLYAQVRLTPLGFGWSKDGNPIAIAGAISGGWDSRFFSVGLGAGWSMYNSDLAVIGATSYAAEDGGGGGAGFVDVGNAFALVQEARLGARDGMNLAVRNTFLLVPAYEWQWIEGSTSTDSSYSYYGYYYDQEHYEKVRTGSSFTYGGLALRVTVPTGDRTDLFGDFSFGSAGATVVEGGVATWMRGNGDRGSIGLQVGAGYGMVTGQPGDRQVSLQGPMVSLGGRYRF